ncbi:MAG: APC family permease [Methanomassiliicoccaceae archaeon]|nr:APC family permease [Methanomassiliicoccaceae archaeon]
MSDDSLTNTVTGGELVRSITWKQGLFIALGVPILILPSLYDVADTIWAFSIVMWTVCVLQGFLQNTAYGEMVTVFPKAAGLPGCAQVVFTPEVRTKKYDTGKLIGAFCAWCYWFAWTPVVSIFTLMIGDYLQYFVEPLADVNTLLLYVVLGLIIVTAMTLISSRGLTGGSVFGLILAVIAIVPLVVILIAAFFTGGDGGGAMFDFSLITNEFLPPGWDWGSVDIMLLFGVFALAQWSGCAWETAALYGPEYKKPNTDVPKALFACGIICLILYFFVSTTVFGSLGMDGISGYEDSMGEWVEGAGYHSIGPIATAVFGDIGGPIALTLLVAAMVLIIQTGFLGSSRTLFYMSHEGNVPKFLGKQNKHGMPVNAMLVVSAFNMILVVTATVEIGDFVGGPMMILAASAVAYCLAHVVALSAYYKSRTDARFKDLERPFSAPRGWKYVALAMVFYEAVILIPCLIYWMNTWMGLLTMIVGAIILVAFFPLWFYTQKTNPVDA